MPNQTIIQQLRSLTGQLFPKGRAFRIAKDSTKDKIFHAVSQSNERFVSAADAILFSILPDNDNFTAYDATLWEQRLGMIVNSSASLADRKSAIIRKMNHPGTILARQSAGYLQDQLQLAGFSVYVHENVPALSISAILTLVNGPFQLGGFQLGQQQLGDAISVYGNLFDQVQLNNSQLGNFQLGQQEYNNKVANRISRAQDVFFNIGNIRRTFVVGGQVFGTFADVPAVREDELRQLILKLKPAQNVGYLLINYV